MARGVFITGTDTGCGKTEITLGLMHRWQHTGMLVAGMKPIASGAFETADGLRNQDALRIQQQCSLAVPYPQLNPCVYAPAIAPHLAAAMMGKSILIDHIVASYEQLAAISDIVVVEGVGGWQVPLGSSLALPDLVRVLDLPVILVVGLRLGCLNHALLTQESIRHAGVGLHGWIANQVDPAMQAQESNIHTLVNWFEAPCLGVVPYLEPPEPSKVSEYLKVPD